MKSLGFSSQACSRSSRQPLILDSAEKQPPDHIHVPPAFAPAMQRNVAAQPRTGLSHTNPAPSNIPQPHRKDNTKSMATMAPYPAPVRYPSGTETAGHVAYPARVHQSPPPFTPQTFFPGQLPQGLFSPSSWELTEAISMLDMNKDGLIWAADLDMLLEIAFGVDARAASAEGSSWQVFKRRRECIDGSLKLNLILRSVAIGSLQSEVAKMKPQAWEREFRRSRLFPSQLFPSLGKYIEGFNNFDTDGNGVICVMDLKQSLKFFCGTDFTASDCRRIIRRVDSVYDGVVQLNDFGALMEHLMHN